MSEEAHMAFKKKAAITGKSLIEVIDEAASKNASEEKKKLENWKIF